MIHLLYAIIAISVFLVLIFEFAVTMTLGNHFVHDKSLHLLLTEINLGQINSQDSKIISLNYGPMNGSSICDSCHSPRSRYYINTANGDYRVPRFSECHRQVKAAFRRLKTNENIRPKY
jgi:hypothetical protein